MSSTTQAHSVPTPTEDRSARRAVTIFPVLVLLAGVLVAGVFRNRPPGDVDSLRSEGGVS